MLREPHSRNTGFWGLTIQRGPWKETTQDRRILKQSETQQQIIGSGLGKGGTEHGGHGNWNVLLAPSSVDQPPPITMEKIKTQSIITKPPVAFKTFLEKRIKTLKGYPEKPLTEGITNNYNYNFYQNGESTNTQSADTTNQTEDMEVPTPNEPTKPVQAGIFTSDPQLDEPLPGSYPDENIQVVSEKPPKLIIHSDDLFFDPNLMITPSTASSYSGMYSELDNLSAPSPTSSSSYTPSSRRSSTTSLREKFENLRPTTKMSKKPSRKKPTKIITSGLVPTFDREKGELTGKLKQFPKSKQSSTRPRGTRNEPGSLPKNSDTLPSPKTRAQKRRAKQVLYLT